MQNAIVNKTPALNLQSIKWILFNIWYLFLALRNDELKVTTVLVASLEIKLFHGVLSVLETAATLHMLANINEIRCI